MRYCDKTTKEWAELEFFYNTKYKGNLTLPEFLELDGVEWDKYEQKLSNPKDFGLDEKSFPFPLGSRLYEFGYIDDKLYVVPYIFGTRPITVDFQRFKNLELFIDKNLAEKELESRKNEKVELRRAS